ncbi:hypothetical protein HYC85_013068 [Camellia sinensis]|uniref:NADP-dependent oxidoreductase domain-containing protein n=1 Tax=Camellia sinensis TaxID=4442 RepID=A0A7J7HEK3_CAMSI|nr:hypothetical protein HYC85_013068 [Camellia sinensis]
MEKVGRMKLGSQGLEVSAQGLGCMSMSNGYYGPGKPEPDMIKLIHHAIHHGITFLDTSDVYGPYANEILLGKFLPGLGFDNLKGSCCSSHNSSAVGVVLVDKRCKEINQSYLQNLPRFQPENLKHNKNIFEQVNELAERKGCTLSQLALAWVHHQGNDVCPIPGTTKIENLNNNIGALSVKLSVEDMAQLESIASADVSNLYVHQELWFIKSHHGIDAPGEFAHKSHFLTYLKDPKMNAREMDRDSEALECCFICLDLTIVHRLFDLARDGER